MIAEKDRRRIEQLFTTGSKITIKQTTFDFKDATQRSMHSTWFYNKGCLVHKETVCLN